MKKYISILVLGLTAYGCGPDVKPAEKKIKKFEINVESINEKNNEYEIVLKTNFPEGTNFNISAERNHKRVNNPELYSGSYLRSVYSVKNKSVTFSFKVDENTWINEYNQAIKDFGKEDPSFTPIDFRSIKDSIEINVLFTPMAKQPDNTIKEVGSDGDMLKGENAEYMSGFNIYNKKIMLYNKFNK